MRTSLKIAFIVLAAFAVFQIYTGLAATFVKSTHGKNESFQWQRFLYFQQNSSRKTSSPGREEQTRPPSSVFGMHRNGTKLLQDHPKSNTDSVPSIAAFLLRRPDSLAENDVQHTDTSSLPWKSVRPNNASLGLQDGAKLLLSSAAGKVKLPVVRVLSLRAENLPACPETPPGLVGAVQPLTGHQNVTSVQQKCEWLEQGGNYRPYRCKAAHRTAILIPYRNRWTHLHVLLANLLPFLHKQQADFTIFVIEQEPPFTFNRALLLNVGVLEASLRDLYTCFIFHDVDLIPLNDRHLYRCREQPKHFAVAINKFGYRLAYDGCVGGVTGLSRDQVEKINGNSNLYFGWGGEDDELRQRIQARGMTVVRDRPQISRYDMFKHSRDHGNEPNPSRLHMLKSTRKRIDVDGLNSLKYNVTSVQVLPLYTWIKVKIDPQQVSQESPDFIREDVQKSIVDQSLRQPATSQKKVLKAA